MVARMTAKKLNYRMCFFFLSGPPLIQNKSPNQSLGTLTIRSQKGPYKNIPTFLGLKRSTDAADYEPTRHVNQFHHPISQPWPNFGPLTFLASTKLASQSIFCRLAQHLFRVRLCICFLKKVSSSLCIVRKSWSIVFACVPFTLRRTTLTSRESSAHKTINIGGRLQVT